MSLKRATAQRSFVGVFTKAAAELARPFVAACLAAVIAGGNASPAFAQNPAPARTGSVAAAASSGRHARQRSPRIPSRSGSRSRNRTRPGAAHSSFIRTLQAQFREWPARLSNFDRTV